MPGPGQLVGTSVRTPDTGPTAATSLGDITHADNNAAPETLQTETAGGRRETPGCRCSDSGSARVRRPGPPRDVRYDARGLAIECQWPCQSMAWWAQI